jgi:hypothetical protein
VKLRRMTVSVPLSVVRLFAILCITSGAWLSAQTWTQYGPLPRFAHSGVYDPTTKQTIVFGGQDPATDTDLNDLWLVSTGTDKHITDTSMAATGTLPAPRYGHVATYDPTTNRMTMFGGGLGLPTPCANDTWVLDGANGASGAPSWLEMSPKGTLPTARIHSTAVYDPTTNSMIVFGGNNCAKSYFNDVWVLSNANGEGGTPAWKKLVPSGTLPSVRESAAMIYDSVNNVMTIFGGDGNGVPLADVWTLSNANGTGGTPVWTELAPTGTAPMARTGVSAIYDTVNDRMTVFGGFFKSVTLTDTWALTFPNGIGGTPAWIKLTPTGTAPSVGYYSASYDPTANAMYIFAGSSSATKLAGDDHAFILSNANGIGTSAWTRGGPATRYAQSMFYDSVSNGMFIFGGQHSLTNTNFSDFWELKNVIGTNNLSWVSVTVATVKGGTRPASRGGHVGLYDGTSNRMMIFGGEEGFPSPCVNDYWVLTGANNVVGVKPTWVSETIAGTPPAARAHDTGVYDPTTNSLIVFGGFGCSANYFNDVWVLSNANATSGTLAWTQLSPTGPGPSARESASATYDSATNTMTVFGGDAGGTPFDDIWILSNANGTGGTPAWTELTPSNNGPVARSGHTAIYDSVNNLMTVDGGWNGTALLGDTWVLSFANGQGGTSAWTQIVPLTTAPGRRFHSAIYAPAQNQINIFGGVDSLAPFEPDDHTFSLSDGNGLP